MKLIPVFFILFSLQLVKASDINSQNSHGETALIHAAAEKQIEKVEKLLRAGAKVNLLDKTGNSALVYAVDTGSLPMVKMIIEKGADLKMLYGDKKESILFEAARQNKSTIVSYLIKKDPSLIRSVNIDGETPLFDSARNAASKSALVLLQAGVPKNTKNKSGETALSVAEKNNFKAMIQVLRTN